MISNGNLVGAGLIFANLTMAGFLLAGEQDRFALLCAAAALFVAIVWHWDRVALGSSDKEGLT